jgi:hypothetical protein
MLQGDSKRKRTMCIADQQLVLYYIRVEFAFLWYGTTHTLDIAASVNILREGQTLAYADSDTVCMMFGHVIRDRVRS